MIRPVVFVLGVALALVGCEQAIAPSSPAYIRGTITVRDSGGYGVRDVAGTRLVYYQRILVEADPTKTIYDATGTPKSYVSWRADTRFRSRSGAALEPGDLKVGQLVSVWITGVVLDSYPDQVGATDIIVEKQ